MVYLEQPSLNQEVVDNQPCQSFHQLLQAKDLVDTGRCGQASILEQLLLAIASRVEADERWLAAQHGHICTMVLYVHGVAVKEIH